MACAVPIALASSEVLEATGQWAGTGALARSWDLRPEEQRRLLATLGAWKADDPGRREVVLACGSAPRPACTLLRGEPWAETGVGAGDRGSGVVLRQLLLSSGDDRSIWPLPSSYALARCAMQAEHVALTGWERLHVYPSERLHPPPSQPGARPPARTQRASLTLSLQGARRTQRRSPRGQPSHAPSAVPRAGRCSTPGSPTKPTRRSRRRGLTSQSRRPKPTQRAPGRPLSRWRGSMRAGGGEGRMRTLWQTARRGRLHPRLRLQ